MTHFILYSRSYCHLCDDMLKAMHALHGEYQFSMEMIDIDAEQALVALYDELVPVLVGQIKDAEQAPLQLCHYFLDEPKVRAFLAARKPM